ncbi:hypothetical protein NLU13_5498 [Sarocladium strictum]|uniref:Protein SSH4 n=1 Tax=Sarocladium strictum TaxID=5046 RepID=A0AA39L7V2_SARSR|nr:hypothetical protein NLU13_5498 [Sarocladium strictum]
MTSPHRHGSSSLEESDSSSTHSNNPNVRSRYNSGPTRASAAAAAAAASHFYTHPSRVSLLNPSHPHSIGSPTSQLRDTETAAEMEEDRTDGTRGSSWRNGSGTPSFSRAFDMFTAPDDVDDASHLEEDRFFVPSYLEGSTYVHQLEEAHLVKVQAQREAKRSSVNGGASSGLGSRPASLPQGSYMGMAHTVIERPPAFEADDDLAPLPTRWNKDDMWGGIEVQPDGLSIKYTGQKNHHEREHEASAVRADHYMPPQCGLYYFEVQIMSAKRNDATIAVGFCTKAAQMSRPIGWEPESWGYHGDDGQCLTAHSVGKYYGQPFNAGDVIGCGVNFRDNTAFFTKNGARLHKLDPFANISRGKLYPAISLKKAGEHVRANFGQTPFVYDINQLMREQRESVQQTISLADSSRLEPGMTETDLVQTLVLQFLQHDGYVETARAFAEDMRVQKEALNMDPDTTVDGINIKDDEDANNRQRIRRAILEGDVDRALKFTNVYYPRVLAENEQVHFRLRCRRFVEMVRKIAILNMKNDSRGDAAEQDMDMDMDHPSPVDAEVQAELLELEGSMLEYGQSLQAEYATDPRREVSKALNEIWSLLAYKNPLKEPQVSHLLDRKGRVAVAEELNSAILLSLGKSSRAALEKVLAQTTVLLEELRQDGGDGAFVSVKDLVDEIPKSSEI